MATVLRQENIAANTASNAMLTYHHDADSEFQLALSWLLPDPIKKHGGRIERLQETLHETEAVYVKNAVERRVMEFTAGRACARVALGLLGLHDLPVGMGARREPLWPQGAVGSISHAAGYCVAAVSPREHVAGLGVDIESASPLPDALINLACTPAERTWCESQASGTIGLMAKFVFSAKEAVFKCLYPVFGEELDFEDAALEIDMQRGRFLARISRVALNTGADLELHGRLACTSELVLTSAFLHDVDCEWLGHSYTPRQLDGCEGRFICN
ncbi:MAG TPA: 4'-phosphopantetheinyl transferase superfamily protein [Gammaproteobacteria bacterium]